MTSRSDATFTDRHALWCDLQEDRHSWDMVIVGGGIIGAGILREAARRGIRALLVEQRDFAWGTSSRSSKMIHGGLRYIANGDIKLTRDSLQERERLLREAPGLIDRMGYFFTLRKGQFPGRFAFGLVLKLYDRLAGIRDHRYFNNAALEGYYAGIGKKGLKGAMYYTDTVTDDARLVLRILQDAIAAGGHAVNYVKAESLLCEGEGEREQVAGVVLLDTASGEQVKVKCKTVVNATGAWADRLRNEVNPEKRIRPLRGSHLVFSASRLPAPEALTLFHPVDKRPVFIFPWEGATVVGTTDLDHNEDMDKEAAISNEEVDYLLETVQTLFPEHEICRDDVISTWSGVRPVIGSDEAKDPSKERRDHAVWSDKGLVTVSGGKLTTFRLIALDAINAAAADLAGREIREASDAIFDTPTITPAELNSTDQNWNQRLLGRYGNHAKAMLDEASEEERAWLPDTQFCLAECRWAARNEAVVHLDDLLLRRTRLGSLLPRGGEALFPALEKICSDELGWDSARWEREKTRYREIWNTHYYLPRA